MKILYISQYFPPEIGAPAARVSELSRHWAELGHQVTILTGFPNHPAGVVPREYKAKLKRLVMREEFHGVSILRSWLLPFANRKSRERILNYSSFFFSSAITGLFVRRPDVVIATSPQLLVALSGWWIARCKAAPFVFEVRDLWPESVAAVGMGKQKSLLYRTLKAIAGFLYRRSDRIVVVAPAFKEHLLQHWQVPAEKIFVVENGVETAIFKPQRANLEIRRKLDAEDKFVISYIGTIGAAHQLETMIEAAEKLQQSMPEVVFLLAGDGAEKERICSLAQSKKLSNLRILPALPREKVSDYIAASDACLVLLRSAEIFKTVIPTKMLEFMSCARPVILGVEGQAKEILEKAQAGISIEPGSAAALAHAIAFLATNRPLGHSFGENGRRYILRHLSRQETAQTYLSILRGVAQPYSVWMHAADHAA